MIFPLLTLALIFAAQTDSPALLPDRLTQAELEHNRPAVIELLTQFTDILPDAPVSTLSSAIPSLVQTSTDPDPHIRSLALLALTALTTRARPDGTLSNDAIPLLEPFLPTLSQHLADPDPSVRQLTALFLGGFLANPTPAVILPLLSTLASAERPTSLDVSVIVALLTVGAGSHAHPEIVPAILLFLHRSDLPNALTMRLIGVIANHPRHSPLLDTGLLSFLEPTHPANLRANLIGVLPHLALSQSDLGTTRSRLRHILASSSEDPTVKAAAAEVFPCWTSPRMSDPCPLPSVHYRMIPQPAKPAAVPPRYHSPLL